MQARLRNPCPGTGRRQASTPNRPAYNWQRKRAAASGHIHRHNAPHRTIPAHAPPLSLLTQRPTHAHHRQARHRRPTSTSPSPHRPRWAPRSPRRRYPSTTPSPRHHHSRSPGRHQARHHRPMSTSPSRPPLRLYPSSTPSPRHRRSRSPRHRHPHHHHRSTSSPRRSRTPGTDPCPPQAPAHLAWWSAPALQDLRRWVKWAGGAGRQDGVHMVHTFEEMCTRTPAGPNEAAPEAIMPQAA